MLLVQHNSLRVAAAAAGLDMSSFNLLDTSTLNGGPLPSFSTLQSQLSMNSSLGSVQEQIDLLSASVQKNVRFCESLFEFVSVVFVWPSLKTTVL